jgi:hypothetical protein
MCPDKKYEWFKDNPDWHPEDRILAKEMVEENWKEFSTIYDSTNVSSTPDATQTRPEKVRLRLEYLLVT